MGKLKGATFGKLKGLRKVSDELSIQMLDFKKELDEMEFDSKIDGRQLIVWNGALTLTIRFTTKGQTVITRLGNNIQNGHEEKLDLKETYDYVSTKIANFFKSKDT